MKRLLSISLVSLWYLVNHPVVAQTVTNRTTQFINLGVGFHGPAYQSGWRPAYTGSFDMGIAPNLTVGATGSYYQYAVTESDKYSAYSAGVRASYYINSLLKRRNKKMDYYAGVGVSYFSFTYAGLVSNHGKVYVPGHLGARRLFAGQFGAFVELGFNDTGFLKLGLTRKF